MKNRGITLGCTATSFCPDGYVTRLSLAAFMNRLGKVLEPKFAHAAQALVQASVNAGNSVCVTTAVPIAGYPRVASPAGSMLILDVGQTALFAILPVSFGGTVDAAGCELTVRMDSHTGAMSPF